jgi:hypothetical protein
VAVLASGLGKIDKKNEKAHPIHHGQKKDFVRKKGHFC